MHAQLLQSCPTLCNLMEYPVLGILQARILEWVAFPFSRGLWARHPGKCFKYMVSSTQPHFAKWASFCRHTQKGKGLAQGDTESKWWGLLAHE